MDGVPTGAWVLSGGIDNQQNISLFGGIGRSTYCLTRKVLGIGMQNKVLTFVITPISCVTDIFTAALPFLHRYQP